MLRLGVHGLSGDECRRLEYSQGKELTMLRDPRQTWRYFAHAVIQEDDPAKLTYLMQQLYRELKENQEEPSLA